MRLTSALIASLCAAAQVGAEPAWRIAVESNYPPFVYEDAQGKPHGLSIDYLQQAAANAGVQLEFLPGVPLQQAIDHVRQGRADLITSLASTPARRQFLSFTAAYVRVPAVLVLPRQHAGVPELSMFAGKRVAVGAGYGVEGYLRSNHAELQLVPTPDDLQALRLLAAGEVDAAVMDVTSASLLIKSNALATAVRLSGEIGYDYALSFAARPTDSALLERLAAGLAAIPLAQRQQINDHWITSIAAPAERSRTQLALGAAAIGLLLWLALTIYTHLRKRTHPGAGP